VRSAGKRTQSAADASIIPGATALRKRFLEKPSNAVDVNAREGIGAELSP
jgi:hypothetical protein